MLVESKNQFHTFGRPVATLLDSFVRLGTALHWTGLHCRRPSVRPIHVSQLRLHTHRITQQSNRPRLVSTHENEAPRLGLTSLARKDRSSGIDVLAYKHSTFTIYGTYIYTWRKTPHGGRDATDTGDDFSRPTKALTVRRRFLGLVVGSQA